MNERKLKEFQQILNYFPLTGISIAELARAINVSMSCLYDFRNGLRPKGSEISVYYGAVK